MVDRESNLQRWRLLVRGRVQGVGFRPFVYRLAVEERLAGCVGNDAQGAFIEVEGTLLALTRFEVRLQKELPPLARVEDLQRTEQPVGYLPGFRIVESDRQGVREAEVTPDAATCVDCLRELFDPADRRYRYPFINCTNCGPRYSIVEGIPYDRPQTTMAAFRMCPACQAEYDDPGNRRFHAQPNACPVCGPRVTFLDAAGAPVPIAAAATAIEVAADWLRRGRVLAIKGLGGFHLACRADLDDAVQAVREAKQREAKPFALMVPDLAMARTCVTLSAASEALLGSWRAPIVLAPRLAAAPVSEAVAPGHDTLGVMLPYTPLHHLLFATGLGPLVMTSANASEEPLCADNQEAMSRLAGMVDGFILHDRPIARRIDDSVMIATPAAQLVPVRRARGYVPEPVTVPLSAGKPVLAVGGDLKSTICLLQGRQAIMSEHLGELANPEAYRHFMDAIDRLGQLMDVEPAVVAMDLHPGYHSVRFAKSLGLPAIRVQHHHAHAVSCMMEHGLTGQVVALVADGTGYGPDHTIWGGELLVADACDYERVGSLRPFRLLGGDAAAREPWRSALSLLIETFGDDWRQEVEAEPWTSAESLDLAEQRLQAGAGAVTSSLGRLFDGVACLLGVGVRNMYEAEAAMRLESLAMSSGDKTPRLGGQWQDSEWDYRPLIRELCARRRRGDSTACLARAFHQTLAAMFAAAIAEVAAARGLDRVVLSGGCFLNRLLTAELLACLDRRDLEVRTHGIVPAGDGGLALGQACIAASRQPG